VDLLHLLLERLAAVRIGFALYGIGPLGDIARWSANESDNVFRLTRFIRAAVRRLEIRQDARAEITASSFLGADGVIDGGQAALIEKFKSGKDIDLRFDLRDGHIHLNSFQTSLSMPQVSGSLISDICVHLAFSENARQCRHEIVE
jgi:hypothetical protein